MIPLPCTPELSGTSLPVQLRVSWLIIKHDSMIPFPGTKQGQYSVKAQELLCSLCFQPGFLGTFFQHIPNTTQDRDKGKGKKEEMV